MTDRLKMKKSISRRNLLKGAAGVAGLAAGSGAITGFPYVHSAEEKVLRYLGTAVTTSRRSASPIPASRSNTSPRPPTTSPSASSPSRTRSTCSTPNISR
jgi:hypothetical protein